MFKRLFSICAMVAVFTLAFVGVTPSRAQQGDPPGTESLTISLVSDIFSGASDSNINDPEVYNGALYFGANGNDGMGEELWKYSSTSFPQRVADVVSGGVSSSPSYLTVYDNALYFRANSADGLELWKYDAVNGAQIAADIASGGIGSNPMSLAVYDNALYFSADGGDGAGRELWKYDPVNGAQRVADINNGAANSLPNFMVVYGNALYFAADGGDGKGYELWKYDSINGAKRVLDLYPGSGHSQTSFLTVFNDTLFFSATANDGTGIELWKYDPINGAQRVSDIYAGLGSSYPYHLAVYNGALYFAAGANDLSGRELWKYDPANGVQLAADIYVGEQSSSPLHLIVYNGALYFAAKGNNGAGEELWKFDNTVVDVFRSSSAYDGWILESSENTTTGGSINASAATFTLGDNAQNRQYRSLLSFDTSTIPDNAIITSVTLRVRKQGQAGDPFGALGKIAVDIRSSGFNANNALQPADFQAAPGQSAIGVISNTPVNNWFAKTWTSGILSYINKAGVTQFRLRFQTDDDNDNSADTIKFFSGNTATLIYRPFLEIKYYLP